MKTEDISSALCWFFMLASIISFSSVSDNLFALPKGSDCYCLLLLLALNKYSTLKCLYFWKKSHCGFLTQLTIISIPCRTKMCQHFCVTIIFSIFAMNMLLISNQKWTRFTGCLEEDEKDSKKAYFKNDLKWSPFHFLEEMSELCEKGF